MKHRRKFGKGLALLLATLQIATSISGSAALADFAESEDEQYTVEAGADLAETADELTADIFDPAEDYDSQPEADFGSDEEAFEDSDSLIEDDDFEISEEDAFVDEAYDLEYEDADEAGELVDEAVEAAADSDPDSGKTQIGTVRYRSRNATTNQVINGTDKIVTYYISYGYVKTDTDNQYVNVGMGMYNEATIWEIPIYEDTKVSDLPQLYVSLNTSPYTYQAYNMYISGWVDQKGNKIANTIDNNKYYTFTPDSLPSNGETLDIYPVIEDKRNAYWNISVNNSTAGKVVNGYGSTITYSSSSIEGYNSSPIIAQPNEHYHFDHWEINGETVVISENDAEKNIIPVTYRMPYSRSLHIIYAVFEMDEEYLDQAITITYKAAANGKVKEKNNEAAEISYKIIAGDPLPAVQAVAANGYHFARWETQDGTVLKKRLPEYCPDSDYYENNITQSLLTPYLPAAGGTLTVQAVFEPNRVVRVEAKAAYANQGSPRFLNYDWNKGLYQGHNTACYTNADGFLWWTLYQDPAEHYHVDHYAWYDTQTGEKISFDYDPNTEWEIDLNANPKTEWPKDLENSLAGWRYPPEELGDDLILYVYYAVDEDAAATAGTVIYEADENGMLNDPSASDGKSRTVEVMAPEGEEMAKCTAVLEVSSSDGDYHFLEWQDEEGVCVSEEADFTAPNPGPGKTARYKAVFMKSDDYYGKYIFRTGESGNLGMGSSDYNDIPQKLDEHEIIICKTYGTKFSVEARAGDKAHFLRWEKSNGQTFSTNYKIGYQELPKLQPGEELILTAVYEADFPICKVALNVNCKAYGEIKKAYGFYYDGDMRGISYTGTAIGTYQTSGTSKKLSYFGKRQSDPPYYECFAVPVANTGYVFDHWEKDGAQMSLNEIYLREVDDEYSQDCNYLAVFKPDPSYEDSMVTVNFRTDGNGNLKMDGQSSKDISIKLLPGSSFNVVTAENPDGYHFVQWTVSDGSDPIADRILEYKDVTLPQSGEITFTAQYTPNEGADYRLTFTTNNPAYGNVFNSGSNAKLTNPDQTHRVDAKDAGLKFAVQARTASAAYVFDHWELNGEQQKHTGNYYNSHDPELILTQDSTLKAVFLPVSVKNGTAGDTYKIQYEAQEGGSVSAAEEYYVVKDETVLIGSEAKPADGYELDGWYQGNTKVSSEALFRPAYDSFKDESGTNREIVYTAKFKKLPDTISGNAGGDTKPSGTVSGNTGTQVVGAPLASADKVIQAASGDEAPAGSDFGKLQLRATKAKKASITLKWTKTDGATGYVLYGSQCGQKMQRLGVLTDTSYTVKGLKKGTYYKYMVVAISGSDQKVVACSKTVHAATAGGKVGNPKKVTVKKTKLTLKVGKSKKNKGKIKKPAGKKVKTHRKLFYESSDEKVATVTAAGKITAVGKGKCFIYVYAQNGAFKKVKVTVK